MLMHLPIFSANAVAIRGAGYTGSMRVFLNFRKIDSQQRQQNIIIIAFAPPNADIVG